jgi:acyl-CoA synthetase (NDP forming)
VKRDNLVRLLYPDTVAVVGASESLAMSNNAVRPMLAAGVDVHLVNPRREEAYGRPCVPSLAAIGQPVDAVLALVNAERSVATLREAADLGCGGVVVAAAGFAEAGEAGAALERSLSTIAAESGLAVVGPNCSGYVNAHRRVNMFTGGRIEPIAGGVAVVSQSGFLVRSALAAAERRALGISLAVSSGNEAVCGLHHYVDLLADDEATRVICLVVEKIREPEAFFAAVQHARARDTAVIALKLGRTEGARAIMQSHTGAIADAAWVYDLAFREHGVLRAADIDDMLDMAQLFAQLPPEHWKPLRRTGIITTSGGVSALATDLADAAAVELPALDEVADWVRATIPGADTVNPLDMTGFVVTDKDKLTELFRRYASVSSLDLLALCWWLGPGDEDWGKVLLEPFAAAAGGAQATCVVTSLEATTVGEWTPAWRERGLATTSGVRSLYRAMEAMTEFSSYAAARPQPEPPTAAAAVAPSDLVDTDAGSIVRFDAAMALLRSAGVPVAPYTIVPEGADAATSGVELGERLVVKLADVPHRTELGAVALDVRPAELEAQVRRLRELAASEGADPTIVVQQQLTGIGEAFAGLQIGTDVGSFVLFGRGGVLVETSGQVAGRLLPLDDAGARGLVQEVAGAGVMRRFRGQESWPSEPLTQALLALDRLWRAIGGWAASVDVNPLVVTEQGVAAVDALIVARTSESRI